MSSEHVDRIAQICYCIKHSIDPCEHDGYILQLKTLHSELVYDTKQLRTRMDHAKQLVNTKYFALQCAIYEKNIISKEKGLLVQYPSQYEAFLQSLEPECNSQYKDELFDLISNNDISDFGSYHVQVKSLLLKELHNRVQMMEKIQLLEKQKNLLLEQQNRQNQYWDEFKQAYLQFYQSGIRLSAFVDNDKQLETEEGEFTEPNLDSQENLESIKDS